MQFDEACGRKNEHHQESRSHHRGIDNRLDDARGEHHRWEHDQRRGEKSVSPEPAMLGDEPLPLLTEPTPRRPEPRLGDVLIGGSIQPSGDLSQLISAGKNVGSQ